MSSQKLIYGKTVTINGDSVNIPTNVTFQSGGAFYQGQPGLKIDVSSGFQTFRRDLYVGAALQEANWWIFNFEMSIQNMKMWKITGATTTAALVGAGPLTLTTALPNYLMPNTLNSFMILVAINGTNTLCRGEVDGTGIVRIYNGLGSANFTAGQTVAVITQQTIILTGLALA